MSPARFVAELARATIGNTFNFYGEGDGAELRRERLRAHLAARADAPFLLVGEAAGHRGARLSGIAFTSERQLTGIGPAEATATIVGRALAALEITDSTLLWNAVPTHPHEPGRPRTNRPPTRLEVDASRPFLDALARGRLVIPVGRVAERTLGRAGIRHPSHGGARAFADGLRRIVRAGQREEGVMDESTVRRHAEAHGRAMVEGDVMRAGNDLSAEAQARARDVMRELPRELVDAQILTIESAGGDEYVSRIRYSGEGREVTVEARWAEREGRPMIVDLGLGGS